VSRPHSRYLTLSAGRTSGFRWPRPSARWRAGLAADAPTVRLGLPVRRSVSVSPDPSADCAV